MDRGYVHQCTHEDELDNQLCSPTTAYIGFDATADCLHVGSMVQIMLLRALQRFGHKPIVLVGGGTTKVGDPSDKDSQRKLLDDATIASNIAGIKAVLQKFIRFGDGPSDAMMIDNDDWLGNLNYLEFLRDYGRHFTINRMLTFESVKRRLDREQPLTFLEFNYMILQGYDFLHLFDRFNCSLQIGGSDQWGNIVNGVELIRRCSQGQAYGLTTPLITTADGAKMGKSADGAIWLDENKLSSFDFWQFWRNVDDRDVGRFLRLFTELPIAEIEKLEALEGSDINEAKKALADEVTRMTHGDEAVSSAKAAAEKIYEQGASGSLAGLPEHTLAQDEFTAGISVIDLLCASGMTGSKGEARRLIRGGGAKVNDEAISDENHMVTAGDLNTENAFKLSAGKKRHMLVTVK